MYILSTNKLKWGCVGKKKTEEPDDCFILAISNHGGKVVSSQSDEINSKIASTKDDINSESENQTNDGEENMEIVESGKVPNNIYCN